MSLTIPGSTACFFVFLLSLLQPVSASAIVGYWYFWFCVLVFTGCVVVVLLKTCQRKMIQNQRVGTTTVVQTAQPIHVQHVPQQPPPYPQPPQPPPYGMSQPYSDPAYPPPMAMQPQQQQTPVDPFAQAAMNN